MTSSPKVKLTPRSDSPHPCRHAKPLHSRCAAVTKRLWGYLLPLLRVRPQQVAHGPILRDLCEARQRADLIDRVDRGREPAVHAEDCAVDQRREREVVEEVGEEPPDVRAAVFPHALVVEAVDLRDLPALVVAADQRDAVGVADLEGQEEEEGLDGVVAPIDEVAEEEVVLVGTLAPDLEQLDEVVELPVDVAAYLILK